MKKLTVVEMNRMTIDKFKECEKNPIVIVLDHIRSLYNVGSIFRTADAMCLDAIYLCGITATPPNTEIHKTALGAEETVEWKYFENTMDAVNYLHSNGYTVISIEQCKGSTMLNDFVPEKNGKYALIMGNEVKGVAQDVVNASDDCIEIPQFGTKHSMNVSVAAGMVIWHFISRSYLH
ncbi:MAG: RNA methyltransferase [Bacteroidaceae bacterium]|nr:RNA methyltransferase [Bacteroidaceae bacterium]